MAADAFVICSASYFSCECVEPDGHAGPHRCDTGCGGMWEDDGPNVTVVAYPNALPYAGRVADVLAGVKSFADDMRAAGIHVGVGTPGLCVTCGQAWPCDRSTNDGT